MASLGPIAPFFIVGDLARSLRFYRDRLGFSVQVAIPADAPFFAIVARDGASVHLKEVGPTVRATPNPELHVDAPWDAFVYSNDPTELAAEFASRRTPLHRPLTDRDDGLRGFEVRDPDGFVLFFGRPIVVV